MSNLETYVTQNPGIKSLLHLLKASGKTLFVASNSRFEFVDAGMRFIIGEKWRDLFEVVIVSADKPNFFTDVGRPFRVVSPKTGRVRNALVIPSGY